jgi:hypothetical protein
MFNIGKVFNYSKELKLQPYQIMGEASPYDESDEESDIEISEDEVENLFEKKTAGQLSEEVEAIMTKLWEDPEALDITLADLKFLKRGQDLKNDRLQSYLISAAMK